MTLSRTSSAFERPHITVFKVIGISHHEEKVNRTLLWHRNLKLALSTQPVPGNASEYA
jgi:hypothetical protein